MQAVLQTEPNQPLKHALEWCLLVSIVLHLAFVFCVAKPDYDLDAPVSQEIKIELSKPEPPKVETKPEPTPQPPKPELKTEPPKVEPKPQPVKPLLQKVEPTPQPVIQAQPEPVVETHAQPTITAKPTVTENKPESVAIPPPALAPEPLRANGPSEGDIDAARTAFRAAAHRELKKNQRYPRIAADRGIEGEVKLNIHLDETGNITGVDVAESSGNNALDEAAVNTAKKSNLKSYFHEILRGRVDNIIVTVSFKLAS